MGDIVRWEEPPTKHGNSKTLKPSKYQAQADTLRSRPGEWALVAEDKAPGTAGSLAWRIKNGVGPFAPARSFESKCIGPAGGQSSKVYARYVGGED